MTVENDQAAPTSEDNEHNSRRDFFRAALSGLCHVVIVGAGIRLLSSKAKADIPVDGNCGKHSGVHRVGYNQDSVCDQPAPDGDCGTVVGGANGFYGQEDNDCTSATFMSASDSDCGIKSNIGNPQPDNDCAASGSDNDCGKSFGIGGNHTDEDCLVSGSDDYCSGMLDLVYEADDPHDPDCEYTFSPDFTPP